MVTLKLWQLAALFLGGSVYTLVILAIGMGLGEQRTAGKGRCNYDDRVPEA